MQCPACNPDKDHDILFNCQTCDDSYCDKHVNNHQHQQKPKQEVNIGGFRIDLSQLGQMSRQMQREPTKEDYENYFRYNQNYLTSGNEAIDLVLAVALLGFVFGFRPLLSGYITWGYLILLIAIIAPSFILHELAHKYTAIHFEYYARFTLVRMMTYISIFFGVIGIPIAAPGAAVLLGKTTKEELGQIKLAGPMTNLVLSVFSYLLSLIAPNIAISTYTLPWIFQAFALVNAFLGLLNMIPIGMFDGQKVLEWSIGAWGLTVLLQLPILLLTYGPVFAVL